jgi:hypothetical protein
MKRRNWRVLEFAVIGVGGLSLAGCDDVIEKEFSTPPDRPVTWIDSNPADDNQNPDDFPAGQGPRCSGAYTYFYPSDLDNPSHTAKYPVITWGNATNANACVYAPQLMNLAKWGFVIVAANSPRTGWGTEMLDAANHLVSENANPSSRFFGNIDTNRFGAMGHSQGAGGAVRAAIDSNNLIKTVVTLALSDPLAWAGVLIPPPDTGLLRVPTFFVRGVDDVIATEVGAQLYYQGTQQSNPPIGAAKAALKGADHFDLSGAAGYMTAWFKYFLEGNTRAKGAFIGNPPELLANSDEDADPWTFTLISPHLQ